MNNRNRWTSLIASLAVALLAASGAQAMTMDFGGADDPSLKVRQAAMEALKLLG